MIRQIRPIGRISRSLLVAAIYLLVAATSEVRAQAVENYIGGYGEMTYHHYDNGDVPRLDIARFVLYFDHTFNNRWMFKSETEIEHVKIAGGAGGEIGLEQAYLDYHATDAITWRGGLIVLPIGIMNQLHEPVSYYSVERPLFDREVIPSTWREIGTGIYGNLLKALTYQLYLTEGLNTSGITMEGLDGAKQEGSAGAITSDVVAGSDASHPALSAKLNGTPATGLQIGISAYIQRGHTQDLLGSLAVADMDVEYASGPFRARAEAALVSTGDAADTTVPTRIHGGYAEVSYNIMPLLSSAKSELIPFVRVEGIVFTAGGYSATGANFFGPSTYAHNVFTAGISFKPLDELILKADYRWTNTDVGLERRAFSLGVGYAF
jgi:opacity protein-like surface antigen